MSIPETPYTRLEMYLDEIARKGGGGGGGGSSTLSGLTDVDISNPTNGQTLVYNATSGKWENGEGSGGGVLVVHSDTDGVLDKTWQEIADADFAVIVTQSGDSALTREFVFSTYVVDSAWCVTTITGFNGVYTENDYIADNADGYPVLD